MSDKPFKPVIQKTQTLVLLAILSVALYTAAYLSRKEFVSTTYETKTIAAMKMQESMGMLKDVRMEKGIFIDQENDPNETGLVGSQFSLITTDFIQQQIYFCSINCRINRRKERSRQVVEPKR